MTHGSLVTDRSRLITADSLAVLQAREPRAAEESHRCSACGGWTMARLKFEIVKQKINQINANAVVTAS